MHNSASFGKRDDSKIHHRHSLQAANIAQPAPITMATAFIHLTTSFFLSSAICLALIVTCSATCPSCRHLLPHSAALLCLSMALEATGENAPCHLVCCSSSSSSFNYIMPHNERKNNTKKTPDGVPSVFRSPSVHSSAESARLHHPCNFSSLHPSPFLSPNRNKSSSKPAIIIRSLYFSVLHHGSYFGVSYNRSSRPASVKDVLLSTRSRFL